MNVKQGTLIQEVISQLKKLREEVTETLIKSYEIFEIEKTKLKEKEKGAKKWRNTG